MFSDVISSKVDLYQLGILFRIAPQMHGSSFFIRLLIFTLLLFDALLNFDGIDDLNLRSSFHL